MFQKTMRLLRDASRKSPAEEAVDAKEIEGPHRASELGSLSFMSDASYLRELDSKLVICAQRLVNSEVRPMVPFRFYANLSHSETLAAVRAGILTPYYMLLAVSPNGEVAGVVVSQLLIRGDSIRMELNSIAVHPRWRGIGLGRTLLDEQLESMTAQHSISFVYGSCSEESEGFYSALGFSVTEPGGSIPEGFVPEDERVSHDPGFERMFYKVLTSD